MNHYDFVTSSEDEEEEEEEFEDEEEEENDGHISSPNDDSMRDPCDRLFSFQANSNQFTKKMQGNMITTATIVHSGDSTGWITDEDDLLEEESFDEERERERLLWLHLIQLDSKSPWRGENGRINPFRKRDDPPPAFV